MFEARTRLYTKYLIWPDGPCGVPDSGVSLPRYRVGYIYVIYATREQGDQSAQKSGIGARIPLLWGSLFPLAA